MTDRTAAIAEAVDRIYEASETARQGRSSPLTFADLPAILAEAVALLQPQPHPCACNVYTADLDRADGSCVICGRSGIEHRDVVPFAPEPQQEPDARPTCCKFMRDSRAHFGLVPVDWGSGWAILPTTGEFPVTALTFCPFCGKRFALEGEQPAVQPGYPEAVIEEAAKAGYDATRAKLTGGTWDNIDPLTRRDWIERACEAVIGLVPNIALVADRLPFADAVLAHLRAWDAAQGKQERTNREQIQAAIDPFLPVPIPDAAPVSDEELKQAGWTRDIDGGGWFFGRRSFSRHRAEIVENACRARERAGRIAGLEWALANVGDESGTERRLKSEIARLRRG